MSIFDIPQVKTGTSEQGTEGIEMLRRKIAENATRIAELGQWPAYIPPASLLDRIPAVGDKNSAGFDAGIACALDLIPRDKQKLPATLHANYSKEAVMQIREEIKQYNPDSETVWWLAACSVCQEGEVDVETFLAQVEEFKGIVSDAEKRKKLAEEEYQKMSTAVTVKDGVPFGDYDGCIQGAYVAGYSFGSMYAEKYGLYFIGTYEPSLGLESFEWSDQKDEKGRPKSGPVSGSKQFVKCVDEMEWKRAIEVVKAKLAKQD